MATIAVNPMLSTNSTTSFLLQTDGFVSGTFLDDPALRYQLEAGYVASSVAIPVWGGLPIALAVTAPGAGGASSGLGPSCVLSTSAATINAWTVFNQASAMLLTASSGVPTAVSQMSVNFIRVGCNLRLILPVKAADVSTLSGGSPTQSIYWDPVNYYITVTSTSNYAVTSQIEFLNTNSKLPSYNSGTGAVTWTTGSSICIRI
jgi:hypothetical protein